jgi:uncharacterized Zn-finger protein
VSAPPSAPSGYSGASIDLSTSPGQFPFDPVLISIDWQNRGDESPSHSACNDGHQGLSDSQSFNLGPTYTLPFSERYSAVQYFDDSNASFGGANELEFNSLAAQPGFPGAQPLTPPDLAEPHLDFNEWIEPQFNVDEGVQPRQSFAATPPAPIAVPAPALSNRVACSFQGCGKTFGRAGDCRRHMKKHGPARFICPLPGCNKPFHRADKLRDHLKQGHRINATRQGNSA